MRTLVTAKQMKAVDAHTIHTIGIPSMVLMERAALWVAEEAEALAGQRDAVWAVCGTGNNGADGVAAARMLYLKGYQACIYVVGNLEKGTEEFKAQVSIARRMGMEVRSWTGAADGECSLLIDAVFGVGLSRPIEGSTDSAWKCCLERGFPIPSRWMFPRESMGTRGLSWALR